MSYGLDGPGSNPRVDEIFRLSLDRPWGPPSLLYKGYGSFPEVESGRGVTLTPNPLLMTWSRKRKLYLYSPYGPYGLYRASVPVQRCTLPLPIPLFPLWIIQPVQSLSTCTTVHFTFTYTSTPPMDRTACTEPQCLYNGALYLYLYLYSPYRPYSLYRASVPVQYSYTSTPPMGRTACTEPQCLYNGALYLYLHLYSPYRPYSLNRASVPVQRCSLPFTT